MRPLERTSISTLPPDNSHSVGCGVKMSDAFDDLPNLTSQPNALFDYGCVEPQVANYLKGEAKRIRHQYATSIVQIGKALIRAKHYLRHGQFIHWVDQQAGIQPRTAQSYMRVAQWIANKNAKVAHLPPTMLYILSARSTPSDYVINIMKMIDAGQDLPSLLVMRRELKSLCGGRRHEDGEFDTAPTDEDDSQYATTEGLVREAMELAAQNMSNNDFERFCEILTSSAVAPDTKLGEYIRLAFSSLKHETQLSTAAPA
jgi:Protein of unknown function (DUF3102)